ncbi:FecR family protein [Flectobacillus rivi]|uniref:FecR family protein n=1 Tax=Flectobacillus rivi TaxID=2984209 RepID=A0ABT6Z8I4_9BACT|nr:FecR family protein [Flectobacillus rivi]MDI9877431.1 FecR family protein [Flectobacillus rivi]
MKKYGDYTIEDFLLDLTFVEWVKSEGHKDISHPWTQWYQTHQSQQYLVKQAREFILASYIHEKPITDQQVENIITNTLNRIQLEENADIVFDEHLPWYQHNTWKWSIAATIFLLLSVGIWWYTDKNVNPQLSHLSQKAIEELVTKTNKSTLKMPVKLPDGSSLLLEPNSTIQFPESFEDSPNREVYLDGQAFFEVVKNPQQPFLVHAKTTVVKVLGTSFTVQSFNTEKEVKVVVKTGKVMVYEKEEEDNNRVTLLPNQQVIVDEQNLMQASAISEEQVVAITSRTSTVLEFNESPVAQIFKKLENLYGVHIYFDQKLLEDCSLTTTLGEEPLFTKLQIICEAIGPNTKFEVVNEKIIIQSLGCNQ